MMMLVLTMIAAAETEVTFEEEPDDVRATAAGVTSDDCNVHTACNDKSDALATESRDDKNGRQSEWLVMIHLAMYQ